MAATISFLLMLQKYINLKQKTLKQKSIPSVSEIFQKIFQLLTWKKKKQTGLNGYMYEFSVDYRAFDTSNTINIHKYSMKKYDRK